MGGSLIPITVCGEAVSALRPDGIPSTMLRTGLPSERNKGNPPLADSPHGDSFSLVKHIQGHTLITHYSF